MNRPALSGVTVTVATGPNATTSDAAPVFPSLVAVEITNATGINEPVIAAVAVFPSLVAEIVAVPAVTAVTTPLASTVSTPGVFDDHAIGRPLSAVPFASLRTATIVTVWPTTRLALFGVSVTVATGASATVTGVPTLCPSLVAVIVALPAATPVTIALAPVAETLAIDGTLDVQVTVRPASTFPPASFVTAVSVAVPPTSKLALVGVTVMDATGTFETVMVAVPLLSSAVALIVVLPGAIAVATPCVLTVAIVESADFHVIGRPPSTLLLASVAIAVSEAD